MQSGFTFHLEIFDVVLSFCFVCIDYKLASIALYSYQCSSFFFIFHRLKLSKYTNKASLMIVMNEKGDFQFCNERKKKFLSMLNFVQQIAQQIFQQYNVKRYLNFSNKINFRNVELKASVENSLRIEARNLICFSSIKNATFYSYTKSVIVANQMPLICK